MVDYDRIDAMVSMRSEGKIKWLQELGPIIYTVFWSSFQNL